MDVWSSFRPLDAKWFEGPIVEVGVPFDCFATESKDKEEYDTQYGKAGKLFDQHHADEGDSIDDEATIEIDSVPIKLNISPRDPRVNLSVERVVQEVVKEDRKRD